MIFISSSLFYTALSLENFSISDRKICKHHNTFSILFYNITKITLQADAKKPNGKKNRSVYL